jgi:hypothetical protein
MAEMHVREKILSFIATELNKMGSGIAPLDQRKVLFLSIGCRAISMKMMEDIAGACAGDDVLNAAINEASKTYGVDQIRSMIYETEASPEWN